MEEALIEKYDRLPTTKLRDPLMKQSWGGDTEPYNETTHLVVENNEKRA